MSCVQYPNLCPTQLQISDLMKSKVTRRLLLHTTFFYFRMTSHCEGGWLQNWAVLCCILLKKCVIWFTQQLCALLLDSQMHARGHPHPIHHPALRSFCLLFPCFWVSTPIHTCQEMSSPFFFFCLIFNLFFWFLLSALLTCFVFFLSILFPFCHSVPTDEMAPARCSTRRSSK